MIHSYSALTEYRICPRSYKARYVDGLFPFVTSPAIERGNRLHSAMEGVILNGDPIPEEFQGDPRLPRLLHTVGAKVEVPLGLTRDGRGCNFFDREHVHLRGKIDVYKAVPAEEVAIMIDWKTGSSRYTDEFQADVYGALISSTIIKRVLFIWVYFNGDVKSKLLTPAAVKPSVDRVIERVEADEDYHPKPGWKCRFCPLKTCEYNTSED